MKMAADLNKEDAPAPCKMLQVIQYWDDSVDAWFRDGSRLALTGCGTAFTYWRRARAASSGRLEIGTGVQQLTQYAISEYRQKVAAVVEFRNRFAERAYISRSVTDDQAVQSSVSPLLHACWPKSPRRHLTTTDDGWTRLPSLDGHACISLAPHRQTFMVSFLLRLPDPPLDGAVVDRQHTDKTSGSEGVTQSCYVWSGEEHSLASVPHVWRAPLEILLQLTNGTEGGDSSDKENEPESSVISTLLPSPLPRTCPQPHLHNTTNAPQQVAMSPSSIPVKVLFSEDILYRVFPALQSSSLSCIEAYPNPSVVLRSRDPSGRYFSCWSTDGGGVKEQVYCTDHPPPAPAVVRGYSMDRVMGQARRLLSSVKDIQTSQVPVCWKVSLRPAPPTPPHQLSSTHVPGLGRFTAHSSGHVRVLFTDRTTLDLHCPALSLTGQRSLVLGGGAVLEPGMCRILLPNGRLQIVPTSHPMQLAGYVEVALDWCGWLSASPEERGGFYQGTVYDENATRSVLAEIERIRQFDHLLVAGCSTLDPNECPEPGREAVGRRCVQEALQRTTRTLRDIDQLLQK